MEDHAGLGHRRVVDGRQHEAGVDGGAVAVAPWLRQIETHRHIVIRYIDRAGDHQHPPAHIRHRGHLNITSPHPRGHIQPRNFQ